MRTDLCPICERPVKECLGHTAGEGFKILYKARKDLRARVAELEAAMVRIRDEISGCLERDATAFMAMTMAQVEAWDIARHNQSHGYCLDQIREVLK